jgi:N6-adenosine-specific RNA methylase IME4
MAKDEQRIQSISPINGKFRTIVIDPPWDYEWLSLAGRAAPGYATMSHEQLLGLDVAQWAEDNCHIYLWTTNNFVSRGPELMAKWGFQHKTVLTWVKPKFGLGSYFRNSTEHVLFGVRGELRTRSDSIATHFEAPLGEHSEKPEEFYDIVRKASYEPYGEVFQRTARCTFQHSQTRGMQGGLSMPQYNILPQVQVFTGFRRPLISDSPRFPWHRNYRLFSTADRRHDAADREREMRDRI